MGAKEEIVAALTASGEFELGDDGSAGHPMRTYTNAPRSLRDVFIATGVHADRVHTLYDDEAMSFADLHARAASLGHHLLEAGVRKGDRVGIAMRNYPEWVVGFWACQAIGAVVVALNAWWTRAELVLALEDSEPKALIVDGERLERLLEGPRAALPSDLIVTRRGGAPGEGRDLSEVLAVGADRLPDCDVQPEDLSTILYTSGTTGRSKGAVATQRNHVTNLMNTLLSRAVSMRMMGVPVGAPSPQVAVLHTLPFFHIGGITSMYVGAATGVKMALMYRWNPAEAVDLVERHGLQAVAGVPIVVRQLLETASASGRTLGSLMSVAAGGAPVPPELIRRIASQVGARASPGCAYGLTETTATVIKNDGDDYLAHPDSIGRPVPTAEIRIVADDGQDLASGEVGEIWCRGPNVNVGYWADPDATEAAFGGGWFKSGDLGYRDAEGLYYVVDRKKDIIIRGGENVYCAEVEAAILEDPRIRDAAVVGLPDAVYGESVAAVLQIDPAADPKTLQRELAEDLVRRLARFKIPASFRITEQELPRTASGKLLKREIRTTFFESA